MSIKSIKSNLILSKPCIYLHISVMNYFIKQSVFWQITKRAVIVSLLVCIITPTWWHFRCKERQLAGSFNGGQRRMGLMGFFSYIYFSFADHHDDEGIHKWPYRCYLITISGNLQFAVSMASLIFQKRFQDVVSN